MLKRSTSLKYSSDWMGIVFSSVCFIHCLLPPIFLALGVLSTQWPWLTYGFVVISFFSIFFSIREETPGYLIAAFWTCFWVLLISLLYEHQWPLLEYTGMASSVGVVICHALNIRVCKRCKKQEQVSHQIHINKTHHGSK